MTTNYAKTSDNYLAHRLFKQKILPDLDIGGKYSVAAVYLDLFEHFAISRKFVDQMVADYVEAGFFLYVKEDKKQFEVVYKP